jgi:hypothetical protein
MDVKITPRITRNGEKIQYTFEWGKGNGQRVASGIFTFAHPANAVQRQYNREALRLLKIKRCQLLLDQQAIGSGVLPRMRFKANFLGFYREYVHHIFQSISEERPVIPFGLALIKNMTK